MNIKRIQIEVEIINQHVSFTGTLMNGIKISNIDLNLKYNYGLMKIMNMICKDVEFNSFIRV